MSDLRTIPPKAGPRFWDAEARKLMLVDYRHFAAYAGIRPAQEKKNGAKGLALLKFRHLYDPKDRINKPQARFCPITKLWGRKLMNACKRVQRDLHERE